MAIAPDGSLLVVDKNNYRVVRLTPDGRAVQAFGGLGSLPESLPSPYDIALGPGGTIHVCDRSYSDGGGYKDRDGVKVFSPDGRFLREIGGQAYAPGEGNNGPYGLDVDSAGNVYVADFHRNRVRRFDAGGNLVAVIGGPGAGPGQLAGPNDVAVDDARGVLYVVEALNARVQKFRLDGEPLLSFGGYGRDQESFSYPQYADLDGDGNLYVSDMGNRRIQKFSPQGVLLTSFSPKGSRGDDWQLMGVTVRRGAGGGWEVLAVDTRNNRILVFGEDARLKAALG